MASKTFSGQLDQAMDELAAEGNKILFIPQQNVGEVLEGAASEMTVESDGTYSIKLAYNTYSIYHYSDVTKRKRLLADGIVVSSETSVTTIPGLIGSTVPVTEDSVLTIQGYLDEANEAKTDAETAQAATEALYEDFDSNVAGAMALVYVDTPSLSAPFNESGRLDYGIGTEYVSGLPVYGVDFTRSTSCYYINKSGAVDFADVDEIAIGKDGIYLHGALENLCTYSLSLYNKSPVRATLSEVTSEEIYNSVTSFVESTDSGEHYLDLVTTTPTTGEDYTIEALVKPSVNVGDRNFYLRIAGGTSSSAVFSVSSDGVITTSSEGATAEYVSSGYYKCTYTVEMTSETSTVYRFQSVDGSTLSYTGDGSTSFLIVYAQVYVGLGQYPIVETQSTSSTLTATSCNVPVSGNLPATGQPFTFVFDAEFPESTDTYIAFTVNSDVSGGAILFRKYNGIIQWFHDRADGTDANLTTSNESYAVGRHRYSLTFNGSSFAMYCDGAIVNSRTPDDFCWFDLSGYLYFNSSYDNQLKNFKILPYAASADEVKSWGEPK